MRKHWLNKDLEHIPMEVRIAADFVLTRKLKAERELELCQSLVDDAVDRYSWILSEDNTKEDVEKSLKTRVERLAKAYVIYLQLDDYFVGILKPYSKKYV